MPGIYLMIKGRLRVLLPAGYTHLYPFPAHISPNLLTLIRFLIHFLSRSLFVGYSRHTFYNHGDLSSIGPCHQTTVSVAMHLKGSVLQENKNQEFNFKTIPLFNLEWEALVRLENKRG